LLDKDAEPLNNENIWEKLLDIADEERPLMLE